MNQEKQGASVGDYGFLMFLTLLNVMNFVDRQLLASFANWIVPDLGLTNTEFGLLTGLIFIFFYSVAGVFMGVLADRVNRTRLIAAGLALWSALTALICFFRFFFRQRFGLMFTRSFFHQEHDRRQNKAHASQGIEASPPPQQRF